MRQKKRRGSAEWKSVRVLTGLAVRHSRTIGGVDARRGTSTPVCRSRAYAGTRASISNLGEDHDRAVCAILSRVHQPWGSLRARGNPCRSSGADGRHSTAARRATAVLSLLSVQDRRVPGEPDNTQRLSSSALRASATGCLETRHLARKKRRAAVR